MDAEQGKEPEKEPQATPAIPVHWWTDPKGRTDGRVLLLKSVMPDGKSYNDFQWPKAGAVVPGRCSIVPDCSSGGLFGWPWGLWLGAGKEPQYRSEEASWIVFAAPAHQVIDVTDGDAGKAKVAAAKPEDVQAEVLYFGPWAGAFDLVRPGQLRWIEQYTSPERTKAAAKSQGASSATGDQGASSATGYQGASSATGTRGASSATGYQGASSATGEAGIAALTGSCGTVEVGPQALGAVTAREWHWRMHDGAVVACRWKADDGTWPGKLLIADEYEFKDGARARVVLGVVDLLPKVKPGQEPVPAAAATTAPKRATRKGSKRGK